MAQKEYGIAFRLAAKMSGQFSKSFTAAGKTVQSLEGRMSTLNTEADKVSSLIKARKTVAENAKAYIQAKEQVAKLGREMSKTKTPSRELTKNFNTAKGALDRTKASLERSRTELRNLDAAMGSSGQSLASLVKRQKELADATDATTKAQEKMAAVQAKLDKAQKAQGAASRVTDVGMKVGGLAAAGAATVGGASAAAGAAMLKMGSEYQASMNRFQAATGLATEEVQKLEASARNIYTSGIGESFGEVTAAMATMRQVSGLTGQALEDATKSAMLLGKTFDMDVSESARASSALMKNFGIDGKEAYDLIAYAAQNGANRNGDLLDTLNEYAVQYKALGFTAEEFTAHLIKGAQDGAFSIDKVGDAIKEFNIRAKDGSTTSTEAFEMLGMNAQVVTQMFSEGGEHARRAFEEVVKQIQALDDPVKKNAVSVALFGTQMEDLQMTALSGFASIQGASLDAEGSMRKITELSTADLNTQLLIVARQLQDSIAPASKETAASLAGQMPQISKSISKLTPYVERLGKAFTDMLPSIVEWGTTIIAKVADVGVFVADNFDKIAAAVGLVVKAFIGIQVAAVAVKAFIGIYQAGLMAQKAFLLVRESGLLVSIAMKALAAGPMLLTIGALGALVAAGIYVVQNWDAIKAKAVELYQSFKTNLVDAMAPVIEQFQGIWTSIQGIITGIVDFVKNVFTGQWSQAWENAKSIFANVFNALTGIAKAPLNTLIALFNSVIKSMNKIGSFKVPDWVPGIGGESFSISLPEIPLLAKGGIATKPTLATIAEGGEAEAVIPLSKLSQMLDPLATPSADAPLSVASRLAGGQAAAAPAGSGAMTVNFAPVITVQGGGSTEQTIRDATRSAFDEFCRNMDRWQMQRSRMAF